MINIALKLGHIDLKVAHLSRGLGPLHGPDVSQLYILSA